MNQKGILIESLLLVLVTASAAITMSNSYLAEQNPKAIVRDYYDLTTKWQNLRFLLDQETSNWILRQTSDCTYQPGTPDFDAILNAVNSFENKNGINCNASPATELSNNLPLDILLSCEFRGPNGEKAVFEKRFQVQKNITVSGTPPNRTLRIEDTQSGLTDYEYNCE